MAIARRRRTWRPKPIRQAPRLYCRKVVAALKVIRREYQTVRPVQPHMPSSRDRPTRKPAKKKKRRVEFTAHVPPQERVKNAEAEGHPRYERARQGYSSTAPRTPASPSCARRRNVPVCRREVCRQWRGARMRRFARHRAWSVKGYLRTPAALQLQSSPVGKCPRA